MNTSKQRTDSKQLLTKVADQFKTFDGLDKDSWYLVVTVPAEISDETLLTHIRSKIPAQLNEKGVHHQLSDQLRELHRTVYEAARARNKHQAVCLVISFSFSELRRASLSDVQKLLAVEVIQVQQVDSFSVTLDHIPDFSHLLANSELSQQRQQKNSLTVTITPDLARVYDGTKISADTLLQQYNNKFIQPSHNRYYEKHGVTQNKSLRHGTGSEKYVRTAESGQLLFVRNVLSSLDERDTVDRVYLFLSQGFKHLSQQILSLVENELHVEEVELAFVSSAHFELNVDADTLVDLHSSGKSIEQTELAAGKQGSAENVLTDAHQIAQALRAGRVATLFISPDLDQAGYVTPDGYCYTYPVKGSKKVENITPWLLKLAAETSATVIVNEDTSIHAVTRY